LNYFALSLHNKELMSRSFRLKFLHGALPARWLLCMALSLSCLFQFTKAQEVAFKSGHYALKNYNSETGLPQNSIKAIVKDQTGFFWLATEDGLVRFDGHKFRVVNTWSAKGATNRITQSFKGKTNGKPYFLTEFQEQFRISNGIATFEKGFEKEWRSINPDYRIATSSYFIANELSGRHLYSYSWKGVAMVTSPGHYYLCDTSQVRYFDGNKELFSAPNHVDTVVNYFSIGENLYYLNRRRGIVTHIDKHGISPVSISGDFAHDNGANPGFHQGLEILWNIFAQTPLLAYRNKIYNIVAKGPRHFGTELLVDGFNTDEHRIVSSFYDPATRVLLLGSHTKGLFVFTKKDFSVFKGSEGQSFHELSLNPGGRILTTFGEFDIDHNRRVSATAGERFVSWNPVVAKNGHIWAVGNAILFLFDRDHTLLSKWPISQDISNYREDNEGNFWMGFRDGRLIRIASGTLKWTLIRIAGINDHISFLQQEKSTPGHPGPLWIGTNHGLYQLTLPDFKAKKIKNLANDHIRTLFIRNPKNGDTEIWGSIYGKGLFLIRGKQFTCFPLDRKKLLASAHCITEDGNGFFWVPTNKGLFQVSGNDLRAYAARPRQHPYYLYYDYLSGFLTNEFNGGCAPCSVLTPDSTLVMPSINGLVHFRPGQVQPLLPGKKLLIDELEYNGKPLGYADTLRLTSDFEFLKLSVSTPYFGQASNVQIDYRLSGNQQKGSWLAVPESGDVVFYGLSSGQYMLMVRKLNGFGAGNYLEKRLIIIVPPAWYETFWFKALLVLILFLSVYLLFKWRTATIKKKNEDLERAVTERTAALKESQNELSRQLNIQAHLIASITHDVRAPLKYVTQASRQIPKLNETGQHKMLNEVSHALEQSLVQMTNFLDNLLSYVRTTLYHSKVEMAQVDLSELIAQKLILFEKVFLLYGNEVLNEAPAGLTIRSNPELLSVVVHNLIDNASKYARNGQIRIFTNTKDDSIHLVIADSGKGIDPEIREWFNNPAAAHSESYGNASPKGFGLVIVKEVARLINLSVFVDNHNGCEFHLVFDTPKPGEKAR
jgi:signal transduction histidine kinase